MRREPTAYEEYIAAMVVLFIGIPIIVGLLVFVYTHAGAK